jgi:FixJ family two-component response regulator
MEQAPTVYLVDDNQAIRDAITLYLESQDLAVASFESATDFLKSYKPERHGCLVLDIRMPGMDGLELQEYLIKNEICIPIIFITGHGDVPMAVRAIKSGASDFLEKPFDNKELLNSINHALTHDKKTRQQGKLQKQIQGRYAKLTVREKEVMALVAEGHSNKIIATMLNISHRTVEIHRRRVMNKMRAGSVPELISMAVTCGIHEYKAVTNH